MLSRFSVKRPYVVVVAVIISLILGGVAVSKMKTDLLPDMDIPYLAVITTDPGASAEKVEAEVTDVLEGSLSTVNGVSQVQSRSASNYSMIFLEFEDGTDMDSALVKVSSAVNEVQSRLPETAGTPNYMEISMDMMATLYATASYEGKDIYQLTDFIEDTAAPALERVNGVADVSLVGTAEKSVEVRLDQGKIDAINDKLLGEVNSQLTSARTSIEQGEAQISQAESALAEQKAALEKAQSETTDQLGQATSGLTLAVSGSTSKIATLGATVQALQAQFATTTDPAQQAAIRSQLESMGAQLQDEQATLAQYQQQLAQAQSGSITAASQFGSGTAQLAQAQSTLESSKSQLADARSQYESSVDSALAAANVDKLVDKATLSQLIMAQNFSMPAGYLSNSSETEQWLLRVGTEFSSVDELSQLLLTTIDGVGDIRISDVADITVVDNVGDAYMKTNGTDGVMLSVFKTSTASTSEVSDAVGSAIQKLERDNPGLDLTVVSDQGSYIDLYIQSILQSLLIGALLAVVILAVFLRDWKPTLIVAFSIPFSVLCAFILMYFSGIELNIMSLGGVSLAIGMLVDNSIIVLENIYRLRARGIAAARAAVQGAKQISGAVVASTLTTICVFLPIVFTTGMVNQLMLPFALTIAYVLCASLVVALTLVPAVSSAVFKNYRPKPMSWFEKVQRAYTRSLDFALRHKALPLGLATVLLVVAMAGIVNTGISMIPSMTSKTISITASLPEDSDKDTAFATADEIMDAALSVDGVGSVSGMDGTASMSMVSSSTSGSTQRHDNFVFYVSMDDSVSAEAQVQDIRRQIAEKTEGIDAEIVTDSSSSESMSSMMGSGLSFTVSGPDQSRLIEISDDLMAVVDGVEGYTKIENGMEDADHEINLLIDKDKLTGKGYTVAQLYQDIAAKLTTSTTSTDLTVDGTTMSVSVVDETHPVTRSNLLDTTIEVTDAKGESQTIKLGDVATVSETLASPTISHVNSQKTMTITAEVEEGYNNALLSRQLIEALDSYDMPDGYSISIGGELENIDTMMSQMMLLLILGFVLIYLVMVAQFQSLLSPFIIIFTVPLAFTGGFFGLLFGGEQLTMLSLMGFAVLMGTVVNNGIVFVDFVNQLRRGGLGKRDALLATGSARIRPILMTALTTILAMLPMVFNPEIGASMQRGMALVVVGGLTYATFTTLYVVPIMYDLLYRRVPTEIELDDTEIDQDAGDAQAFLAALHGTHAAQPATASAGGPSDAVVAVAEEAGQTRKRRWFGRS